MPNLNKKLSQDSPCEIKLACSGQTEEKKDQPCEKIVENEEAKEAKPKERKSGVVEQATLNKKPCDKEPEIACHLARPDHTSDPTSRIDKAKPGCINFESCEEDEEDEETVQEEVRKLETGCLDYEDCTEYEKEEKRRLKTLKEEEKQRKKEKTMKDKAEKNARN